MSPPSSRPYAALRRLAVLDVGGAAGRTAANARRYRGALLVAVTMLLVCGALALAIARAQSESRSKILSSFALRGQSSATLISTYVSQQADRERSAAARFLRSGRVSEQSFATIASAFGTSAALLLDSTGRLLASVPADPRLRGMQLAAGYPHLLAAEHGGLGISDVVASAVKREPVTAIAVPFATPHGRRVFSAAYQPAGAGLQAFVDHAIAYPEHEVLLVDSAGRLLAASPVQRLGSLSEANALLASALEKAPSGTVPSATRPSTYTSALIPDTPWRIVIEVPDYKLYASISGLARVVPWIVLGIVSLLGLVLVLVFVRLSGDRARLRALSGELRQVARTDALTGLLNRRGLTDQLPRIAAAARRRGTPMSVLMMDLDHFKEINDTYGHDAGDRVLCTFADCMRDVLRAEDVYGRLGGDEFMVVLAEADEQAAARAAARLIEAARACELTDLGLPEGVPVSIGTASAAQTTPEEIMRAADVELYRVKGARRSQRADAPAPSRAT